MVKKDDVYLPITRALCLITWSITRTTTACRPYFPYKQWTRSTRNPYHRRYVVIYTVENSVRGYITVYHRRFVLVTRNRKNIDSSLLYFLRSRYVAKHNLSTQMLAYFDGLDPVYIAKHPPTVIILPTYVRLNTCTPCLITTGTMNNFYWFCL